MITISPRTEAGSEIVLSRQGEEFEGAVLEQVAAGISQEDMVPVSVDELRQSYACIGSFVMEAGDRKLAAFGRLLKRMPLDLGEDAETVCVTELGSVWVAPEFRGMSKGYELISHATRMMTLVGFLPVAVCNSESRRVFEKVGYEPIASMINDAGRPRVIEVFSQGIVTGPTMESRLAAIQRIGELERFHQIELLV